MKTRPAADIWKAALEELQIKVSPANYQTWLKNTVGLSLNDGCFTVGVPSSFVTEALEKRLNPLIEKTLTGIAGKPLKVQFQVHLGNGDEELAPPVRSAPGAPNTDSRSSRSSSSGSARRTSAAGGVRSWPRWYAVRGIRPPGERPPRSMEPRRQAASAATCLERGSGAG